MNANLIFPNVPNRPESHTGVLQTVEVLSNLTGMETQWVGVVGFPYGSSIEVGDGVPVVYL